MGWFRRRVLYAETSPYESRHIVVESDATASTAHLLRSDGTLVTSLPLVNHRLSKRRLSVVWSEEGDGVAILEGGSLLGIIPGWVNPGRGFPGYRRDTVERSPLAWPLAELGGEAHSWVARARRFWAWRSKGWGGYQSTSLAHLERCLGRRGRYIAVTGSAGRGSFPQLPAIGMAEYPADESRPYTVFSSIGMGTQRMPHGEPGRPDTCQPVRVEVALATMAYLDGVAELFSWLGTYPWRACTRIRSEHPVLWASDRPFPLGEPWSGVLVMDNPEALRGPSSPELRESEFRGDPVRWLWIVPLTADECTTARCDGSDALMDQLRLSGRTWIATKAERTP